MNNEKAFTKSIIKKFQEAGWDTHNHHGGLYQRGFPDISCVKDGVTIYEEHKFGPKGEVTVLQQRVMEKLASAGALVYVRWGWKDKPQDLRRVRADGSLSEILVDVEPIEFEFISPLLVH